MAMFWISPIFVERRVGTFNYTWLVYSLMTYLTAYGPLKAHVFLQWLKTLGLFNSYSAKSQKLNLKITDISITILL